ncbi:electron transfer flavoprotein subunit alpha [Acidobacteria bacterium Mor1]|nr:electron transfer flavoprotein subunit alpha [Acidobacteria bacterium Mor1]
MATILTICEVRQGALHPQSLETVAAGQQLAAALGAELTVALPGNGIDGPAGELAAAKCNRLVTLTHEALEPYTPDGFTMALDALVKEIKPDYVLMPHTYQVRDFAPKLSARSGRGMIADCVGMSVDGGKPTFMRQMFQGKTQADVVPEGDGPHFVSFQAGAYRADAVEKGDAPAAIDNVAAQVDPSAIRSKPEEPFREGKQAVDLSKAEIVVAVGRGIKSAEALEQMEKLAQALGGEVAASRPVCDEGWLPMERQIGSSGQTVAPKLYIALGISGAIQHVVGMKGANTIVAVNKDKNAPIFEIADYGIVGDLFEVVPAMLATLEG